MTEIQATIFVDRVEIRWSGDVEDGWANSHGPFNIRDARVEWHHIIRCTSTSEKESPSMND